MNIFPQCTMMMEIYEQSINNIMNKFEESPNICSKLALCSANDYMMLKENHRERRDANEDRIHPCTWGLDYLCANEVAGKKCNVNHK